MQINYIVKDPNNITRELVRPWCYAVRHLELAFITNEKCKRIYLKSAIANHNQPIPQETICLKDRVTHLFLGLAELFLPIINYAIAFFDFKTHENKQIINFDKTDEELRSDAVIKRTDQQIVDDIYDLFEIIHKIFDANHIKYSLAAGSQLGATRNGGVIPWDDDGDAAVLKEDETKILSLRNEFSKHGCQLTRDPFWGIIIVSFQRDSIIKDTYPFKTYPFIDLFLLRQEGDKLKYAGVISDAKYSATEFYSLDQWNSVEDIDFGHLKLKGLPRAHAVEFLERSYGKRCLTTGVSTHDHLDALVPPPMELVRIDNPEPARHSAKDPKRNEK